MPLLLHFVQNKAVPYLASHGRQWLSLLLPSAYLLHSAYSDIVWFFLQTAVCLPYHNFLSHTSIEAPSAVFPPSAVYRLLFVYRSYPANSEYRVDAVQFLALSFLYLIVLFYQLYHSYDIAFLHSSSFARPAPWTDWLLLQIYNM